MTWMLDTNACIRYLNGRAPHLKSRLEQTNPAEIALCSVVKAELFYGAARSYDPQKTRAQQEIFVSRFSSLPFDDAAADAYARIRADVTSRGVSIGPNDLLIAAIALSRGVTLVTHNVSEFSRVQGLKVEDWEQP